MKMVAPDRGCKQVDVGNHRYTGTIVDATPADAAKLKQVGYFPASLGGPITAGGYDCSCGFRSVFRRCSRCGESN